MKSKKLPDFIIVGTMKSGTSSLAYYLNQHPQVFMPEKEVHFFDNAGGYKKRWGLGLEWYARQFESAQQNQLLGEKTPTYSYLEDVPERIHKTIPETMIIWIFRDPIKRTYSNYWHAVIAGTEKETFNTALNLEEKRLITNPWQGYKKRGMYAEQVERYLKYFSRDQMFFTTFEELIQDPKIVLGQLCHFLDLPFDERMPISSEPKNISKIPRILALRYSVRSLFGASSLVSKVERKLNSTAKKYPPMPKEQLLYLRNHFAESNERLEELTGLEVKKWWT